VLAKLFLWKRWLTDGVKPFDWLMLTIEMLVLGVIAAEALSSMRRAGKVRKWRAALSDQLVEGQSIKGQVPNRQAEHDEVDRWCAQAAHWQTATVDLLATTSDASARATFLASRVGPSLVLVGNVHSGAGAWFRTLDENLDNLRSILERHDVYL
jgi:hypothetical protein